MNGTDRIVVALVNLAETLLLGGIFLVTPRVLRRGLLFGVYIGEAAADAEPARAITRSWRRAIVGWTCLSLALGAAVLFLTTSPVFLGIGSVVPIVGFLAITLRAYFRSRTIAVEAPDAPSAAALLADPKGATVLPWITLCIALVCGIYSIWFALDRYASMPARIPVHFGFSGEPDRWAHRSTIIVLFAPLMTMFLGAFVSGIGLLVSRAKRAIRYPDDGASIAAQQRFRSTMTRFVCGLGVLLTLLLTELSIASTRVAAGELTALPMIGNVLIGAVVVYAIGGALYIALRLGQGGARLERSAASAPLTNGLADNSRWWLGMFYFAPDDPSILVEKRFGVGYTLNFGNRKAMFIGVGVLFLIFVIWFAAFVATS